MLKGLASELPKMNEAGIALHAITCETGGVDALKARLAAKEIDLPFPIHSDPDARLCATPGDGYYITEQMNVGEKFGDKLPNGDSLAGYADVNYMMVQPAFEVVDKTGALVQNWSWHSLEPPPSPMEPMTKINGAPLVILRPVSSDIVPSIQEGRNVRVASCF